jgi:preprotein translocase subunit SecF
VIFPVPYFIEKIGILSLIIKKIIIIIYIDIMFFECFAYGVVVTLMLQAAWSGAKRTLNP